MVAMLVEIMRRSPSLFFSQMGLTMSPACRWYGPPTTWYCQIRQVRLSNSKSWREVLIPSVLGRYRNPKPRRLEIKNLSIIDVAYGIRLVHRFLHLFLLDWHAVFVITFLIFIVYMQVMNFDKGRLMHLLWKNDKCKSCAGNNSTFVCLNGEQCAIRSSACNSGDPKTKVDCSLTIQLTFSGTDKFQNTLNTWFELSKIQQYSLFQLYSNLRNTLTSQYHLYFWFCIAFSGNGSLCIHDCWPKDGLEWLPCHGSNGRSMYSLLLAQRWSRVTSLSL
jgi:hypothetical protein